MAVNVKNLIKNVKRQDLIITPRLEAWLVSDEGGGEFREEIGEVVKKLLTTKPRDRSASFSASAAGQCHRKQVLSYLGVPSYGVIDARLQNIFIDGTWRHLRWQSMLLQIGILSDIERPLFWRKMRTRGTMDGIGVVPEDHPRASWRGKDFGFELKGVNQYSYKQLVGKDQQKIEHKQQVNRYFLLSGLELFVILYEDKNSQETQEWVVEPDPQIMSDQLEELKILNESVDTKTLPPVLPSCKIKTGSEWQYCQYGGGDDSPCLKAGNWIRINGKDA